MNRINPEVVKAQIATLLVIHPELAEDEESLALSLDSETDAMTLLNQIVARLQQTKSTTAGLSMWLSDLRSRIDMLDRREEALRKLMFQIMETAGIDKLELPLANISVAKGPRKVIVTDKDALPKAFLRYPPPEPDKTAIREFLKDGGSVNGAYLSNGEDYIRIKVK